MIDPLVRAAALDLGLESSGQEVAMGEDEQTIEALPIEKPLATALRALLLRAKNNQIRISEDDWMLAWIESPPIRIRRDLQSGDMVVRL